METAMVVQENESELSCPKCRHFRRKSQHHSIYLFDDPLPPCCDCQELNPAYLHGSPQHHKKTSSIQNHLPLENSCVTFQYYNSQFASNSTSGYPQPPTVSDVGKNVFQEENVSKPRH